MRNVNQDLKPTKRRAGQPRPRTLLEVEQLESRLVPTTIVLGPSKDNTLYESTVGNVSNGAGHYFFAGRTSSYGLRRGVIAFNLLDIPAGSTVNSVSLRLNVSNSNSGASTMALRKLSADWGEGTSNAGDPGGSGASATTNDATWVHRFFNTANWNTAGGNFVATVSASASVGGVGAYTWGSSTQVPQMVADVQGWLDTPNTNFGWILLGDETTMSAKRFDTKENPTPANRPTLTIDYSAPLRIIDDGDATGFIATAGFFSATGQGYQNSVRFADRGTGSESAAWTFTGIEAGIYRVSTTWTEHENRASNAAYTITHGSTDLGTVRVNQERAPNHFSANGGAWFNLGGIYTLLNTGNLTVRLTDAANDFVIADAVRLEKLTMGPFQQVVDDGDAGTFVATEGFVPFGGQGHGNDVAFAEGTGGHAAIWIFSLTAGTYRVSTTWTEFDNRATNAPYFLFDGDNFLDYAPVNQQLAPDDFSDGGTAWEDLGGGVYSVTSGVMYVFLLNDANGFVIADAIRVERLG